MLLVEKLLDDVSLLQLLLQECGGVFFFHHEVVVVRVAVVEHKLQRRQWHGHESRYIIDRVVV